MCGKGEITHRSTRRRKLWVERTRGGSVVVSLIMLGGRLIRDRMASYQQRSL
jgi:hypothetical protein